MKKVITALLLSALVLCSMSISAFASPNIHDENAVCSLNLEYMDTNQPLGGVQFLLYRVADVDKDMTFTWTHAFEKYHLNPDPKQAFFLSQTLAAYVARDGLSPNHVSVTDNNRIASFGSLTTGMYLVTGESYTSNGTHFTPVPTLVFFPFTDSDGRWAYHAKIEVKFETAPTENINLKALKVWDDDGSANRPDYIDVQLICDNFVYDEVRLSKTNDWRYVWNDMEKGHNWDVIEKEVPDGYYTSTEIEGITFVITNTAKTPEKPQGPEEPKNDTPDIPPEKPVEDKPQIPQNIPTPDPQPLPEPEPEPVQPIIPVEEGPNLPQTGLDWDPVIYTASAGIGCMLIGLILRKKTSKKES